MTVSATYNLRLDATETLTVDVDGSSTPVVIHDKLGVKGTLNATSSPPAAETSQVIYSLVTGAKTIDLTALLSTNGRLINGTGLKVRALRFQNLGAHQMTIGKGASSGYDLFGGSVALTVPACGASPANTGMQMVFNDGLIAIDGTHKTIDVGGTGTDQFALSIVLG